MVMKNEDGNLIIMSLIILLVISLIGTSLIFTGGLEHRMVFNDKASKQATLAADSGVEWARVFIIERLNNQVPINEIKYDLQDHVIIIGNNISATIKDIEISKYNSGEIIKLTSEGAYKDTRKRINVTLQFHNLPSNPIKANRLKVAGRYNEYIDNDNTWFYDDEFNPGWVIKTYFKPWGQVMVNNDIECKSIINAESNSDYFNTKLAQDAIYSMWPKSPVFSPNPDRPAQIFNSDDFLTANRQNYNIPAEFSKGDVANFYRLAITDTENWTIWEPGTFSFAGVTKPFNYVKSNLDNSPEDISPTNKVEVIVKSNFAIEMGDYLKLVFNKVNRPQLPAPRGDSNVILIVSNDNIEWTIDANMASVGKGIDLSDVTFYLLSSNNVILNNNCLNAGGNVFKTKYKYNVNALAGKDIDLNSSIENVTIKGSLQAHQNITIDMSDMANDPDEVLNHANQAVVNINGENIIDNFPLHWSSLGVGKIVEYVGE